MSTLTESAVDQFRTTIERSIEIDAAPEAIFESVLEDMADIRGPEGQPMNFKIESFPGGRWYRDLGDNTGHLWGHVQVIKPPKVIEVYGPLMISAAAISHVTYRVVTDGPVNTLKITHKLFGDFDPKIPAMVGTGWQMAAERVKAAALKKK